MLNPAKAKKVAVSYNGNVQYKQDQHEMLVQYAIGLVYGKDSFYESFDTSLSQMKALITRMAINEKNCEFIANVILFVRNEIGLRTLPIVMVVEFANALRNNKFQWKPLRYLVTETIQRADDITEMFAYAEQIFKNKKSIPLALKKGIADAFLKFDEYQMQKYNRQNKAKKLKDVMCVTHPKPLNNAQADMFKRLLEDKLDTPYTWETVLSANGQLNSNERKTNYELWNDLVTREGSGNLPYQAMLRNLRNIENVIYENGVNNSNDLIQRVVDKLTNEKTLERMKLFPWSFIKAYDSVQSTQFKAAINNAAELSAKHIPKLGNKIWIILDESGSMGGDPMMHAANLVAALVKSAQLHNTFQVKITKFAERARNYNVQSDIGMIPLSQSIKDSARGGGTNLGAAIDEYDNIGFVPDCVIVLSDMQVDRLDGYSKHKLRELENQIPLKLAFNLHTYNSTPLTNKQGWIQFSGWSDRLFQYLNLKTDSGIAQRLWDNPIYQF